MKKKKQMKRTPFLPSLKNLNRPKTIRYALVLAIILIGIIMYKKIFFIILFCFLNWFVLYMWIGYGIRSPIEVITFGTFMTGYVYGPVEALIVSGSSLISISITGRLALDKIFINMILFLIAFLAQYTRGFNVAVVGILALAFRYLLDFVLNFLMARSSKFISRIPERIVNFFFWVLIYTSFGQLIEGAMRV